MCVENLSLERFVISVVHEICSNNKIRRQEKRRIPTLLSQKPLNPKLSSRQIILLLISATRPPARATSFKVLDRESVAVCGPGGFASISKGGIEEEVTPGGNKRVDYFRWRSPLHHQTHESECLPSLGPITLSTIPVKSTRLELLNIGSTSVVASPGGGHNSFIEHTPRLASPYTDEVSTRILRWFGRWGPWRMV